MAKVYVTDKSGKNPVPFLRGILTRSLNEAGLAFEQAYKVASDVRDKLDGKESVTNPSLRTLVTEHLSANFPKAISDAYRVQNNAAAGVQVRNSDQVVLPFSRTEHLRCLAACGLSQEQSARASTMILARLSAQQRWEVTTDELREFTRMCLAQHFGDRVAERYRVWMQLNKSGRPLILLIGGTSGSGKSTVATSLAHRLGIVRTQSSDMLREVMRMLIPERLLPVLHCSSFEAWQTFPSKGDNSEDADDLLVAGYLRQTELLSVPCEAVISRAIRERVSLILEGVHVQPGLAERIPDIGDAVVVPVMLGVLKPEDLRKRLSGRLRDAPDRSTRSQLDNFDHVWRLQAFLLSEADRTGTPILINDDKDKVTDLILRTVVDVLAENEQEKAA